MIPGLIGPPVFVDWHGVLSRDTFWHSIIENTRHPYRNQLISVRESIFSSPSYVEAWMRGEFSTEKILHDLEASIELDKRAKKHFLIRRLISDYRRCSLNEDLTNTLRKLRGDHSIVIATDNMDLPTDTIASRKDIWWFADDIISSSDVGVLKYESPELFFGTWLTSNGFAFKDAILIDDNEDNCIMFRMSGGQAVHWRNNDSLKELEKLVSC